MIGYVEIVLAKMYKRCYCSHVKKSHSHTNYQTKDGVHHSLIKHCLFPNCECKKYIWRENVS